MSSRHPMRGDAVYPDAGPPRLYPVRNLPPVMIAGPPSLSPRPLMGFIPYNAAPLPQQPTARMMYPYRLSRPTDHRMMVPGSSMMAATSQAGVDLRSQPLQPALPAAVMVKQTLSPQPAPQQPTASTSSDQPLDLSVRAKPKPAPVQERIVDTHKMKDVPLDLSKSSKPSIKEEKAEAPINMAAYHKSSYTKMFPSPNYPGRANSSQVSQAQAAAFSGFTPPSETAVRSSGRSSTPSHSSDSESSLMNSALQSMSSVSSLIGNHPIDDILYLHCKRCQSSYGSVHAFRKHFRNVHGIMPSSDDVLIQGIKATKEFEANKNELNTCASIPHRFHCTYCGWQGDQNNHNAFTRHLNEHYEEDGRIYRCLYCKEMMSDANSLKVHLPKHTGVYLNPCPLCFIAFETETQLSLHFSRQHRMAAKQPKIAPAPISVSSVPPFQMINTLPMPYRSAANGFQFRPAVTPVPNPANDNHSRRSTALSAQHTLSNPPHSSPGWSGPPLLSPSKPEALAEIKRRSNTEVITSSLPSPLRLNHKPAITSSSCSSSASSSTPTATVTSSSSSTANISSAPSLHSVLNAAVSLAVSSAASATNNSSGAQTTQINLMSLLDKVVEQGLRNAESSSPPVPINLQTAMDVSPQCSNMGKELPQSSITGNDTSSSATSTLSSVIDLTQTRNGNKVPEESSTQPEQPSPPDAPESTGSAQKMVDKSLFDHIAEAVTRELMAQQTSNNNNNHNSTDDEAGNNGTDSHTGNAGADSDTGNNGAVNCNGSSVGDLSADQVPTNADSIKDTVGDDTSSTVNKEDIDTRSESDDNLPPAFVIDESAGSSSLDKTENQVTDTVEANKNSSAGDDEMTDKVSTSESEVEKKIEGEEQKVEPEEAPSVSNLKPSEEPKTDSDCESSSPKRLRIDLDSGADT